jgi:hypothetical protein
MHCNQVGAVGRFISCAARSQPQGSHGMRQSWPVPQSDVLACCAHLLHADCAGGRDWAPSGQQQGSWWGPSGWHRAEGGGHTSAAKRVMFSGATSEEGICSGSGQGGMLRHCRRPRPLRTAKQASKVIGCIQAMLHMGSQSVGCRAQSDW